MNIKISKKEVFNEVEKRSSIEGLVIPERYDNIWANKERGEILDSFWIEGCTAVIQLMKKYLSGATVNHSLTTYNADEEFTIDVVMPGRYDSNLDGNIVTDIKMLIACNILNGWFEVMLPESAGKYVEISKGYSEDLRVKLLYRKSPESRVSATRADSESILSEEAKLAVGAVDETKIGGEEAKLAVGAVDETKIGGEEAKLAVGAVDDDEIDRGESDLSLARADDVDICNHLDALKYPEDDDIPLQQIRRECCYIRR